MTIRCGKRSMAKKETEIEKITADLVQTMRQCGIDPTPYGIAIRMTAETLQERDRVYQEYMLMGESRTALQSWNVQARACLSMLKLTPWRVIPGTEDTENE